MMKEKEAVASHWRFAFWVPQCFNTVSMLTGSHLAGEMAVNPCHDHTAGHFVISTIGCRSSRHHRDRGAPAKHPARLPLPSQHTDTFRLRIEQGALTLDPNWVSRYNPYNTGQARMKNRLHLWLRMVASFIQPALFFPLQTPCASSGKLLKRPIAAHQHRSPAQSCSQGVRKEDGVSSIYPLTSPPASSLATTRGNGLLTAVRVIGDNEIERLWQIELHTSARPVIVSDREVVYANDFVDGRDHLVVLDLMTGEEILRVPTPATRATIATSVIRPYPDISWTNRL